MLMKIAQKILDTMGIRVTRTRKRPRKRPAGSLTQSELSKSPLSPSEHLKNALWAAENKRPYVAYAELKTAEFLGLQSEQAEKYLKEFKDRLPDRRYMNHNQYFRFRTLSSEITFRGGTESISVLDVGGGQGELASFLPSNYAYCLAEPTTNGISGTDLPFVDGAFDYVISCHVLEHVPIQQRALFLDQLVSKAKRGVILLNPFEVEGTFVEDRLRLVIDITDAEWAKEHLNCSLPHIDDLKTYAESRNLVLSSKPNGAVATSLAFVFLDYFSKKSGQTEEWAKVNAFFNEKYSELLDSEHHPNSYLVFIGRREMR